MYALGPAGSESLSRPLSFPGFVRGFVRGFAAVCLLWCTRAAGTEPASPAPPSPEAAPPATASPSTEWPTGTVPAMTLENALAWARAHKPKVQAALARMEVAQKGLSVLRSEWQPQVGGTAQFFYGTMNNTTAMFQNVRTMDLPRVGASRTDPNAGFADAYPSTLVGIGARQLVFDFGRIGAQVRVAQHDRAVTEEQAAQVQLELSLLLETTYFAVLTAHEIEHSAKEALSRIKLHHAWAQAGVERGLRPPLDLSRAAADLAKAEAEHMAAAGQLQQAQALLADAVGVPFPLLDAVPRKTADEPPVLESRAFQDAIASHPAVRAKIKERLRQQAVSRATLFQWVPTLQATASVNGRAGGAPASSGPSGVSGFWPGVPNWDVGLVLSVPLYDGTLLAKKAQSEAQENVLRHELAATERQVLLDLQRAYTAVRVAAAMLPALRASALAATRNQEQASARFRAGLGTSVELSLSEALRTEAEIRLAIGTFEVAKTRALFLHLLLGT